MIWLRTETNSSLFAIPVAIAKSSIFSKPPNVDILFWIETRTGSMDLMTIIARISAIFTGHRFYGSTKWLIKLYWFILELCNIIQAPIAWILYELSLVAVHGIWLNQNQMLLDCKEEHKLIMAWLFMNTDWTAKSMLFWIKIS